METISPQSEPFHLDERQWRSLLRDIHAGQVLPVIGPELVTITSPEGKQLPLYRHLALELATRLKVTLPKDEPATLNAITCAWLISGKPCKSIYDEIRDMVDNLNAEPPKALLELTSITDFELFISTTFDPFASKALQHNTPGFLPERNILDFHPNNPREIPSPLPTPFLFHILGTHDTYPDFVVWEEDYIEYLCGLPLNMFYNTGIATYIWVLSNRKPAHREGSVQLIDATQWFRPLRKNLGKKNCELSAEDIDRIARTFLDFQETPESKIFLNEEFGYWKVTVERPLRLHSQLTIKAIEPLRFASGDEEIRAALINEFGDALFTSFSDMSLVIEARLAEWDGDAEERDEEEKGKKGLPEKKRKKLLDPKTWERDGRLVETAYALRHSLGETLYEDHNIFRDHVNTALKQAGIKLPAADLGKILKAVSWRVETAPPVIAKVYRQHEEEVEPLYGFCEATRNGKKVIVEYEPDPDLRDTEQVALVEEGGIDAFIRREVLPYTPDASIRESSIKIGYEISFTRHFYKPRPSRTLEEIAADILAIEQEAEGLLDGLLKGATR